MFIRISLKFFIIVIDICRKLSIIVIGICHKLIKEVFVMPGRDGTGPLGDGAMTGRGLGVCGSVSSLIYGRGLGLGRGLNCRRVINPVYADSKEALTEQKAVLEARLEAINNQLNK
jgi:hypothetical protein